MPTDPIIKIGAEGAAVKRLQTLLNDVLKPSPKLAVDGKLGPATRAAVVTYQRTRRLEVDGIVGPVTWTFLRAEAAGKPLPKPPLAIDRFNPGIIPAAPAAPARVGPAVADYLVARMGAHETWDKNDGPLLNAWDHALDLEWMTDGNNPWCGMAVQAAFLFGAGLNLARLFPGVSWVYTPSIDQAARAGKRSADRKWKLQVVSFNDARKGDIVLFDWDGGVVDHVGIVTGRVRGGMLPTVEGNTPKTSSGDQSGLGSGDGIWPKLRERSKVQTIVRIVPA